LQSAVATAIANEIQVRLTPEYNIRLANARPLNPKVLDVYLAGRYHLEQMSIFFFKRGMEKKLPEMNKQKPCNHFERQSNSIRPMRLAILG